MRPPEVLVAIAEAIVAATARMPGQMTHQLQSGLICRVGRNLRPQGLLDGSEAVLELVGAIEVLVQRVPGKGLY